MDDSTTKIIESIRKFDVAAICSDLIKIPSYSGSEQQEKEIAFFIRDFFNEYKIDSELQEVFPGRPNVIATLPGCHDLIASSTGHSQDDSVKQNNDNKSGQTTDAASDPKSRSLLLNGHLDTVPKYDMKDPFSGRITGGRIYGRGACDMKGPIAAMMVAVVGIKTSGIKLTSDLYFAGLIDEEVNEEGVRHLVKTGPFASASITGEPTGMKIALGQKGLEWFRLIVHGKKVHSGSMEEGRNAVVMAARIIKRIEDEYAQELRNKKDEILGYPTINIGRINGGDQPSTVPDYCEVCFDRRFVRDDDVDDFYSEMESLVQDEAKKYPGFSFDIRPFAGGHENARSCRLPFCTDKSSDIINSINSAVDKLGFKPKELTTFPAWTDAGTIHRYTKSDCLIMGPGEISLAHSANESIGIDELKEAAEIYAMTALEYCGTV